MNDQEPELKPENPVTKPIPSYLLALQSMESKVVNDQSYDSIRSDTDPGPEVTEERTHMIPELKRSLIFQDMDRSPAKILSRSFLGEAQGLAPSKSQIFLYSPNHICE